MATMYEMIMDLPLFKGVGKDHVSQFLEKTNVGFANYEKGDAVTDVGEEVTMVRFIISGLVRVTHEIESADMVVEELCGRGVVLGADRLFGISTGYSYEARAEGKVSIMQFSKEQYVNLLHSDRIYMLNFFNYLSLRAQRPVDVVSRYSGGDLHSRLCQLIGIITHPLATGVVIDATDSAIARFGMVTEDIVREWKRMMQRRNQVKCDGDRIAIVSRRSFLENTPTDEMTQIKNRIPKQHT